jgi:hypothetical protein
MAPKDPAKLQNLQQGLTKYVERRLARVFAGKEEDKKKGALLGTASSKGCSKGLQHSILRFIRHAHCSDQLLERRQKGQRWALHSSRPSTRLPSAPL